MKMSPTADVRADPRGSHLRPHVQTAKQPALPVKTDEPSRPEHGASADKLKASGVVSKLQEGHFRGVADVRLRINFADEIAAHRNEAVRAKTLEALPLFVADVTAAFDELVDGLEVDEHVRDEVAGALQAFDDRAATLNEELKSSAHAADASGAERLRATLDELLATLSGLLNPSPAISPAAPEVSIPEATSDDPGLKDDGLPPAKPADNLKLAAAAQPLDEPATDALAAFGRTIFAALDRLVATAQEPTLPALSEPNGRGRAFARFAALYEQMNGAVVDTTA